jgi:hypothetical protein
VTRIAREHSDKDRRVESDMMEEPERGLARTESGLGLGRRATASWESRTKQRQKPSIFMAGSQVFSFTKQLKQHSFDTNNYFNYLGHALPSLPRHPPVRLRWTRDGEVLFQRSVSARVKG